jgi:hypothetical protein
MKAETRDEREKVAYLSAYRDLMLEISIKEERLARIDAQLYGVRGVQLSDMPKGGETKGYADYVAIKVDLFDEINNELKTAHALAREIKTAIAAMPSRIDRLVLEMRHIDCMSYEEMAEKLAGVKHNREPYSVRHVTRMYWAAVGRFNLPK